MRQATALEGFFSIMNDWVVDDETARKILRLPADWKRGQQLSDDALRRIEDVAGIWKRLQVVYSPDDADAWVKKPNRFFSGQAPLEKMAAGDLAVVRAYVDAGV
jgi:hypothetical protein